MRASLRRSIAFVLSLALVGPATLVVAPETAMAQPKKPLRDQLTAEARQHYDNGVALAQRKTNWDGAKTSFQAAYDISHNPRVLFNVAICERELGHYAAAVDLLKRELSEGKGQLSADEEADVKSVIGGLEKFVAQVTVQVSEPGADVFIDNERIAPERLNGPISVGIGERRIRATKPGYAEALEVVQVASGATRTVSLKLAPLVRTARVNVAVLGPSNATVKIDGKVMGPAPYAGMLTVSSEPHIVTAEAPGYVPAPPTPVTVKEGEVSNVTLQLSEEQLKGKLSVVAKPEGATIEIDGKPVGASRWEGPVDARTHQVTVKKQGFYTWTYDVDVPRGAERSVSASLNEDRNTSFVPWLIGSLVVGGVMIAGIVLIATPPDQQAAKGTLPPFAVGTGGATGSAFRF